MRARTTDSVFALVGIAAVAVLVPQVFWPGAALYRSVLGAEALLYFGDVTKLVFLFLSGLYAVRSAAQLEAGNPARRPWTLLAVGLFAFFAGQAILGVHTLVLHLPSPFPSPADIFFVAAYPFLIAAFVDFIRAYREAGLPVGTAGEHVAVAAAAVAVFAVLGYALLVPILAAPATTLERLLNAAYPSLDLVLLIPILILVRIAWRFQGGRVARVWALLLTGCVCLCGGDIVFAWFSTMGMQRLDPLVNATYILAYLFLARGTMGQYELLTD